MTRSAGQKGGDTRQRILQVALEVFAANGFEGTKTRDIAARAAVNQGLITYYFETKLKLWRAAVDLAFSAMRDAVAIADAPELEEHQRASHLLKGYVRFVAQNPQVVRLLHDEGRRRGERMRWMVDRHVRPMYEGLIELIGYAQDREMFPGHIEPAYIFYTIAGAVSFMYHQAEECRRLTGLDASDDEVVEAHAEAVVSLLLAPAKVEIAAQTQP